MIEGTEAVRPTGRLGTAKWFTAALVSIFAVVLFIGWRGDSLESVREPDDAQPFAENLPIDPPTAEATDGSGSEGIDADTGGPVVSGDGVASTRETLMALIGGHRLAYASADGIAIVEPAAAENPVSVVTPEQATMNDLLVGFDSFSIFHEQGHTYGFQRSSDSAELKVLQLFTQGQVVAGAGSSFTLAVGDTEAADQLYVGNSSGLFMSRVEVPVGAELLVVPSVGVLVISSTGETFVTTQSGLRPFSQWPVTAANGTHHVEIRCPEPLVCAPVLVDRPAGSAVDLPAEFAGTSAGIEIAPDGSHLLLVERGTEASGPDRLYYVAAAGFVPLSTRIGDDLAWAPDSTVAAWMDPATTDPRLWVLDVASAAVRSVDLINLGAPTRSGNVVVLLAP